MNECRHSKAPLIVQGRVLCLSGAQGHQGLPCCRLQ